MDDHASRHDHIPALGRRALLALGLAAGAAPSAAHGSAQDTQARCTLDIYHLVEAYAGAWQRGDVRALVSAYHDAFTLHNPGTHSLAGVHHGKPAALRILGEVARRTNRQLSAVISVMAGADYGAIVAREQWSNAAEQAQVERVFLYTVRDGKLAQCWLYDADQMTVARFLA